MTNNMEEIERDMPECDEPKVVHDVHEMTMFEIAEAELKAEERKHKHLFDNNEA